MSVFAYFGPSGTFTEMALDKFLDHPELRAALPADALAGPIEKLAAPSPVATIAAIRSGAADFACVPIESSLEGSVPATMDALVPDPATPCPRVQVFAEVDLDISFTIAARPGTEAAAVTTLAAYPVAAAQVRAVVGNLFPAAEFVTAASNAAAAQDVAAGRADAAVTTAAAATAAGLSVLADAVSDASDAVTRFLILGRPAPPPERSGRDRTSVILDLPNVPGSLMAAMNEFASRGIDLTRIQSRPRRDPAAGTTMAGQYWFFLDAVGHIDDAAVAEALQALYRRAEKINFLGSWPISVATGTPPPDHAASVAWLAAIRRGGR
ncbi:MAG: prephenate dehydratase [Gordonia sp. (in: high G+C Gram-positive bacteria)]